MNNRKEKVDIDQAGENCGQDRICALVGQAVEWQEEMGGEVGRSGVLFGTCLLWLLTGL